MKSVKEHITRKVWEKTTISYHGMIKLKIRQQIHSAVSKPVHNQVCNRVWNLIWSRLSDI